MDIFGDTDPKKMPGHFFFGSLSIDYKTAIRANTEKQNYSVCPRHWYIDTYFKCEQCAQEFKWSALEQKVWFEDYFFWVDSHPRHCLKCRVENRRLTELRKEYDANVADARKHGTLEQKRRIVDIVSELQSCLTTLPKGIIETKELFERQIKKQA